MRALPLLAALAVCCARPAAPAAPAAPALLVLRAACGAGDADAFSEARLLRHARKTERAGALRRPFRLLNPVETCGPAWRATVTRDALTTLSGGARVALAGWAGHAACGALDAAARALGRPRAAACAEGPARAAAAALLCARLRWTRALLPPAPPASECAAALADLRRELAVSGVAVRAAALSADELDRRPQVVVVCTSALALAQLAALAAAPEARPALLLLHVPEPDDSPVRATDDALLKSNIILDLRKPPYERKIRNLSSTTALPENANLSLFYPGTYKKSFPSPPTAEFVNNATPPYRNKRTRYGVESAGSPTSKAVFRASRVVNTIKTDYDSLRNNSPVTYLMRAARQTITENEFKVKRSADTEDSLERRTPLVASIPSIPLGILETLVLKLNETFRDRTLILSSQDLEFEPSAVSMIEEAYDSILDSLEQDSINQTSNGAFFLYEIMPKADETHWQKIATLTTVSHASLGAAGWATRAALTNASGRFERWSSERPAEGGEASSVSVPVLIACISLALGAAGALGLGTRCAATRRRRRRRRGDAVLAAADFCFPADERRRVGEGMETMLSCWLQQLHEFGGPELERPDLLKQPAPAPAPSAPSAPSSTTSINRVALDRRTRYKGDAVHMKYLPTNAPLELKRKATDVLLVMQSLRHENLNPFIGCLCELRPALVFDHCGRGSLEDVLMLDEIKLDWTFRLSLLTDLVKGMRYLHASPLRAHGRLSSRNCVVDARWVLRVSDYGLPALARAQGLPLAARAPRDLLWTAPELLREARAAAGAGGAEGAGAGRGSPAGDVFSFAIIMQEVIVRGEPYCMLSLTPEEIIEKLMRPPPLIRPSVSMGAAPPEAVSVMRQCWAEAPELRPDFGRLHDIFRHLHKGRKINIVDSMFEMLEKYSNNLEDLIRERTEQLDMEKKKTEQLLNRMLPRSVAERLLLGSRVEPEEFEDVSIYFSDIVGFTELAARSTPVQVVDLLNDLYTAFDATIERYAVYKVETIGDAYMVVGGLPVRARGHAESVATMALHLLHVAGRFRVRHLPATPLRLRAGLHSGPVCAAVVGLTMPRYCLFGDTVNTASRMESTGAAWRIQVSAATAERLAAAGGYRLRSRGLTQVKGKGAMHTYWLLGKDGFDKPLPVPPPLENGEEVLFETDGENESEPSPPSASPRAPAVERQRSDPCSTPDKFAWQRSGAVSADSSPPRARAVAADHSAPYARYKCLAPGARVLRRQWSLERDAPEPAADERAPAKYRTRPEPAPDAPP